MFWSGFGSDITYGLAKKSKHLKDCHTKISLGLFSALSLGEKTT